MGDSEEGLADSVQQGQAIVSNLFTLDHDQSPTPIIAVAAISNFLFQHLTFLLPFPFYNPDAINLHVLMVLSIGGIINAMLLPVVLKLRIHAVIPDYILKKIILTRLFID